jgi:serine protease AprX
MADSDLLTRLQQDSSGIRLILVPKRGFVDDPEPFPEPTRRPSRTAATAARLKLTQSSTKNFESAVRPIESRLRKIGLTEAKRLDRSRSRNVGSRGGEFESLSLVRAVAVRVEKTKEADRVIDATQDAFDAILDVRTQSDPTLVRQPDRVNKAPKTPWPAWTGVKYANADSIRGNAVLVGVLDTGVDADHAELRQKKIEFRYVPPGAFEPTQGGRNVRGFDTDGHGTHVCGIVAGAHTGVAPDVNLHVAAVIESETLRASLWRTVYGLDWMFRLFTEKKFVNIPCVINLSLCFFEKSMEAAEVSDWKLILGRAIEDLHRKDALVIAAAGNLGKGR